MKGKKGLSAGSVLALLLAAATLGGFLWFILRVRP